MNGRKNEDNRRKTATERGEREKLRIENDSWQAKGMLWRMGKNE